MINQLVALIVDEGKWLTTSMGLALVAIAILLYRHRHSDLPARQSSHGFIDNSPLTQLSPAAPTSQPILSAATVG